MTIQDLERHSLSFYDASDHLKQFVYSRSEEAFARGNSERNSIQSIKELEARQKLIREKFREAMGGIPSSDTALNAKVTGTVKCDGFRIEKVIFESRPQTYVTANLYIPEDITAPTAAIQFLCGHSPQAKHSDVYHIVCLHLVEAGLIVMAQDPVGQGERFSYYESSIGKNTVGEGTSEHAYAGCQCLPIGDTVARYFLHDAIRGLDYLCSRPEVDHSRIGVTGNSGGGTQTSMMMICDPRVSAAAPGTFLTSRQENIRTGLAQDSEQTWPGLGKIGFDHEDILLCMVPKPVMVLAVKYDFFPIEGTRMSVERTKRFWDMYGKGENIQLFEDDSGHKYTVNMAKAAAEFFTAALTGKQVSSLKDNVCMVESKKLWCTGSGQIRKDMPNARFVFDDNFDRLTMVEKSRELVSEAIRKKEALHWLKKKVFESRKPCDINIRHIIEWQVMDLTVKSSIWWSQKDLLNHALTFRNYAVTGKNIPVTIAVWDGGTTNIQPHLEWIRRTCESGRTVQVLNTSGVGAIAPNSLGNRDALDLFGIIYKLCDDLIWLDDSLAAMRTYDVIRAVDALGGWNELSSTDVRLYAHGKNGIYARLAAFIDDRVKGIDVKDGMESYAEWVGSRYYDPYNIMSVILPGMLKYFDLPDLDRWTSAKKV